MIRVTFIQYKIFGSNWGEKQEERKKIIPNELKKKRN